MKLVGLVGSNADLSYNRKLLQFIAKHYTHLFDLELLEIKEVPLFDASNDQTDTPIIQSLNQKISQADGIIIATPEHIRTTTPALKATLEWLSYQVHPFTNKPVYVIGASYHDQGTSRAQLHVKQILQAPGMNAYAFPGNEFLLGEAHKKFDEQGNLTDQGTIDFLSLCLEKFCRFVRLIKDIEETPRLPEEDLEAKGQIETTIADVDMNADDWLEQASEQVKAVKGSTYIELDRGLLTVNQLDALLKSMPFEITYADANNQFLFYNHNKETEEMLAKRRIEQVGNPLASCHPPHTHKNVKWVIQQLRSGQRDMVRVHIPTHGPQKFVVHTYAAIKDPDGKYLGINEYVQDIQPLIDWYLTETQQKLVSQQNGPQKDFQVDAVTGASQQQEHSSSNQKNNSDLGQADAISGATRKF
ncbi:NAD(P)H-dependent oxidoreductase [Ignavigranum ruoffiae]|uniref:NAD(P)H-dependent oxidoreductase n=1 Tax=Ignavigranum ruoffiae TaxID=89093 RepID=UPI002356E6F4|nr:NAD(P)H-dependent oxidoreductase [Ignavigranum ruoffiae]